MKPFIYHILLMASVLGLTGKASALINTQKTIDFEGRQRRYVLYVPENVSDNAPLVVSLHGAAGHDTDRSPFRTSMADEAGCIVVYPQGENQNFGPFGTVPGWDATGEPNTDTRFLRAVVEDVAASYPIDRKRIYCCGFSNGGMMTYANANCCADLFAAFAAISGFPLNEFHQRFTGPRPVPMLHIHGKSDDFVKYSLMPVIRDNMVYRNGLNPLPQVTVADGKYCKSVYSPENQNESFPYEYVEVDGMGHNDYTSKTEDGNSARTMWNFFSRFTLDSPCDTTLKWRCNPDTPDFDAAAHGWIVSPDSTRLQLGTSPAPGNSDNNVYHSLQFNAGNYALKLRGDGTVYLRLETLSGTKLLSKKCDADADVVIPFEIPSYGQYRIIVVKENMATRLSRLEFYSTQASLSADGCMDAELPDTPTPSGALVEIPQSQGREYDNFARTDMQALDSYTLYTATGDLQIAFKMMNVDMTDCDYVLIKFAEPVAQGWKVAFHEGTALDDVPTGATSVRFDLTPTMRSEGKIPQICMMTFFGTRTPLVAKVEGVFKHNVKDASDGIAAIETDGSVNFDNRWFDLNGHQISRPSTPGIYISQGRKIAIQ